MRDRLIRWCDELKQQGKVTIPELADYLISKGVIVPPCPVGEKIYTLVTKTSKWDRKKFVFIKTTKLTLGNLERAIENFGTTVFAAKLDAERELRVARRRLEK